MMEACDQLVGFQRGEVQPHVEGRNNQDTDQNNVEGVQVGELSVQQDQHHQGFLFLAYQREAQIDLDLAFLKAVDQDTVVVVCLEGTLVPAPAGTFKLHSCRRAQLNLFL